MENKDYFAKLNFKLIKKPCSSSLRKKDKTKRYQTEALREREICICQSHPYNYCNSIQSKEEGKSEISEIIVPDAVTLEILRRFFFYSA